MGVRSGVFNSRNFGLYSYAHLNPLVMVDPDGLASKYFVIHSTSGEMSKAAILDYKNKGYTGKGHAYIMRSGEVIQIVSFDQKAWATRREKQDKSLIGSMYHIELNYAAKDSPTDAQYKKLAELYKELSSKQAPDDELLIVPHREVDRGIKGGHDDPTNFDFKKFYEALKEQGVDVDKIKKITQERYSVPNRAEHKSNWPPVLEGPVEKKN